MSKKIISHVLALIMALGVFCPPAMTLEASELGASAVPTASTVLVNGENVAFDAYNIGGNNYFKLRDLAYTLSGTAKQFNVGWDAANNAITLTSGQGYAAVGGEMSGKGGGAKTAVPTNSKIIKDGNTVSFTAYNIDGNNYFKLRDIGEAFDFGVDWDGVKNTIVIDTGKGYAADTQKPGTTEPTSGRIDKNLIGEWNYEDITSSEHHNYFFYENGTASLFITGNTNYNGEAKFSTSDGKIYLTEYYYINAIGEKTLRIDKVVEYSVGKDERGEYLTIGNIPGYTEYGENRPNMKFRKGAGITEPTIGRIDLKLVGTWEYLSGDYYYVFKDDGSFMYVTSASTLLYSQVINGKYNTANVKIYLTDLVLVGYEQNKYKDLCHDYSFGTDEKGEYLLIPQLERLSSDSSDEQSYSPKKFYKTK